MRKDVGIRPPGKIKLGSHWQEVETGLRHLHPSFAHQAFVQNLAQTVQVQYVRGRVFGLRLAARVGPPVAGLLVC